MTKHFTSRPMAHWSHSLYLLLLALALPLTGWGQGIDPATPISITTGGTAYTQNFDGLASTGATSSTLPTGFGFAEITSTNTTYTVGTGSSATGDTYSFGNTGSTDRAFGSLLSGSVSYAVGAAYTNNTGGTITSLAIGYTGEQWRMGTVGREDRLEFGYSTTATSLAAGTYTPVTALNFIAPSSTGTVGARDGTLAANRTAISSTITGLSIPAGATFYIRWFDFNATSADDGLGVDDFSLTATVAAAAMPTLAVQQNTTSYPSGGTAYAYGNQAVGTPSTAVAFTLSNTSADPLTIGSITTTGDYAVSGTAPTTVAAGSTATVSVIFTPASPGTRTGTLVINSNATNAAAYTVNLTGTGVGATPNPEINVQQGATTYLTGSTYSGFPTTSTGSTSAATVFTIQNTSTTDALTISGITTTGDFATTGTLPTSIPTNSTATVSVTFAPTATGTRTGTLVISSNDQDEATYTINLSGQGQLPAPTLSNINPATILAGQTTTVTFTGTNFVSGATVDFNGGSVATTVTSSTSLTADIVAPASGTTTTFPVSVTTPSGTSGTQTLTITGVTVYTPISIAAVNTPYNEDFNTLATTGTSNTLPAGWAFTEVGSNANTVYTAGTGSGTGGDTYSFGSTASTDRSFGTLASGSLQATIGAGYVNNTGTTITSLAISYTGELWRLGVAGRTDQLTFGYSTGGGTFTTATYTAYPALDFLTPTTTGATGARDGNTAPNRGTVTGTISGLSIPAGATFFLRWVDPDITGTDDGLGIDDFSLTANPTIPCVAPANVAVGTITSTGASVSFAADASNTSPYTVTATPTAGGTAITATGTASPISLTGLAASTSYSVTVTAICTSNAGGGTSPASAAVTFSTPAATPTCVAPTAVAVGSVTSSTASVSFTGDATATGGYTVTATPATGPIVTATSAASPIGLTGLVSSTAYSVTVTSNCGGANTATSSPAVSFTTALGAPTLTSINPSSIVAGQATTVTFTGTNFVSGATVDFNGGSVATTVLSSTSLTASITPPVSGTTTTYPVSVTTTAGTSGTQPLTATGVFVLAPISIAAVNTAYTENFNSLAITGTGGKTTLPPGFDFAETGTGSDATYTAGTGSDTGGDTYSFGSTGSTDRALGTLLSGSVTSTIGAAYTNNTGTAITSLAISYAGEEWRLGSTGRADQLNFQYSTTATGIGSGTFTSFSALDFNTPVTATTGAKDGNLAANRTAIAATISGLNIPAGATFYIRWTDFNASGADDGLGIDDFSLTANPIVACSAPGTPSIGSITQTTASVTVTPGTNGGTTFTVTATPTAGGTAITATGASPVSLTGLTAGTSYSVTATSTCNPGYTGPSPASAAATFSTPAATLPDLVVNSAQNITGNYNNVTVTSTGSAGVSSLTGPLTVAGTLLVQSGGRIDFFTNGCQAVTGTGNFVLEANATIQICDPNGITTAGLTGSVQLTGTRSFSNDANYIYAGSVAQVTGSGLPTRVRNLNGGNVLLTLSGPVGVAERLLSGNINTNNQMLTLLSSATGTALVSQAPGTAVTGNVTVQRYIDSSNPIGYRHYSAPVSNTTLDDLAAPGFSPTFNTTYNASPTPGTVTPFPTVFGYDQNRVGTVTSTYGPFDKGWFSPAAGAAMVVNRGYTVNAPNTALVDFVGTLNDGPQNSGALAYSSTDGGWYLLGNPYPAPLDWSTVTGSQIPGVGAAMYVFQSSGQYGGSYRSYANGIGSSPLIPAASGYFVRVGGPGINGAVNLTNANRITTFGAQPAFGRGTADTRPQLHLQLRGTAGLDEAYVYFEAGATAGRDVQYDATKLTNPSGLNLSTLAGTESLTINGLPVLGNAPALVPLFVGVPSAGSYTFEAADLANFTGAVTLIDALTGTRTTLSSGRTYGFTLAGTTAPGRFSLEFRPAGVLATGAAQALAAQIQLFPNPASASFRVQLPLLRGQAKVQATLSNALGQAVLTRTLSAPAGQVIDAEFDVRALAAGIYTLRLNVDGTPVVRKVVVE